MRRVLSIFRYFLYLAVNHNAVLAFGTLYDEIRGELTYKISTSGIRSMTRLKRIIEIAANAREYMPANYILLEKTLLEVSAYTHNNTLIDIGCGKGRVLFVAPRFGFEKVTGIEFYEPYCKQLEKDISLKKARYPDTIFSVICGDASRYLIPDHIQTIFFNNPFDEKVMAKVILQIMDSVKRAGRDLYIIYMSPVDKQLFLDVGFEEIYAVKRFGFIEAAVLRIKKMQL